MSESDKAAGPVLSVRNAIRDALEERPYRADSIEQKIRRVAYALGAAPGMPIKTFRCNRGAGE